jgi:ATP-binding cassette subfamily F protein uup
MSAIASASALVVKYGPHTVLDHASLTIDEGERVGLVGRNGTGKSTFLQIAAGVLEPDAGEFTRRRDLVTGYMPQVFGLDEAATVHDNILAGAKEIQALLAEYESVPPESNRSAVLLDRINHFDGWNLESRARLLIANLHAPDAERPVSSLSGGERRRVALCRALLARPDFLILDEPTNHLDTGSIEWLEDFLSHYGGSCLFVTHDRYFLDRIATRIVELSRGQFHSYEGNYTEYLLARAERQAAEEAQEHRRQKFLKRELAWVRSGVEARRTKSVERMNRYFEMTAQEAPEAELDVDLIIPPPPKLANRVIALENISAEIDGRTLFRSLDLDLAAGERLGIVGRNGVGKSTLLRVILGEQPPATGEVKIGARTQINYIDQDRIQLDEEKTVYDEVGENSEVVRLGDQSISLRSYLRRFLFSEERINTKIAQLSGGERSRILLAKILKRGGNVLILDEPTNDLDLGTLRLLEEALVAFAGSVIVVSHDRYFLNRVCTSILAFEGHGVVTYWAGNYDYYLQKRQERDAFAAATTKPPSAPATATAAPPAAKASKPRKLSWKEERELEGMEAAIEKAEAAVAELEALFAAPDFYQKHGQDWQELEAKLKATREEVQRLYARWEELEAVRAALG